MLEIVISLKDLVPMSYYYIHEQDNNTSHAPESFAFAANGHHSSQEGIYVRTVFVVNVTPYQLYCFNADSDLNSFQCLWFGHYLFIGFVWLVFY